MSADFPLRRDIDDAVGGAVLDALIGDIHECALDATLWDDTLARLAAALGDCASGRV